MNLVKKIWNIVGKHPLHVPIAVQVLESSSWDSEHVICRKQEKVIDLEISTWFSDGLGMLWSSSTISPTCFSTAVRLPPDMANARVIISLVHNMLSLE